LVRCSTSFHSRLITCACGNQRVNLEAFPTALPVTTRWSLDRLGRGTARSAAARQCRTPADVGERVNGVRFVRDSTRGRS
jgi:hypothetical protein